MKRVDGAKIRAARQEAGMTQQDLAYEVGTALGSLNRWELNKNQPYADNLAAIARATGKPLEFFFTDGDLSEDDARIDADAEEVARRFVA